jgi:hypothetical protein
LDVEDVHLEPVLHGGDDLAVRSTPCSVAEKHRLARSEPAYGRRVAAFWALQCQAGPFDQAVAIRKEHRRRHATSLPHLPGWIGWDRDVVIEVRTAPARRYDFADHSS